MSSTINAKGNSLRVARHRKKIAARGAKRVEVTVSAQDASLIKAIAEVLRANKKNAIRIRQILQPWVAVPQAKTAEELITFLRSSPLVETGLSTERDQTTGRPVSLD